MNHIVFLIFRSMRRPLITLVMVYAVSILGLVLIPGVDDQGNVWHVSFFHALYFISYTATTIGFGEIPYDFTDAQRLWTLFSMYAGVISWLYAIGTILSLLQDKTFQHALSEHRFTRKIRGLREPFYLVCGYGETGSALVKGLTEVGYHVVVIEIEESRRNMIQLDNLREYVPSLHGDARKPLHLMEAGLQNSLCQGVVAVTNDNETNLKIAITSKLLHPMIKVICRADSHDTEKNMSSFGTNYIIDPYDTFATYLATAFQVPCLHLLHTWMLSRDKDNELAEPIYPPRKNHWIVCGFGRFGKAVYDRLIKEGIEVKVIEALPETTGQPKEGIIEGRGTEADTLMLADIENASGLIAGTDNDANNLSIVVTARELNSGIFTIIRQNHMDNSSIIDAVNADMVMHPSKVIAEKIRVLLGTPMLYQFLSLASYHENDWACELVSRISALVGRHVPQIEEIAIDMNQSQAVVEVLKQGEIVKLADLMRDPWEREEELNCLCLFIQRHNDKILLPPPETELKLGDRLLVSAGSKGFTRLYWNLQHDNVLSYVRTGKVSKHGWLWRKLSSR